MEKEYVRIQWENRPSIATPLGQINLNKMDYQIDKNENTLIAFDTTKANQSDLLQTIRTLTYDTETGIFVFTFWNGSTYSVDLNIEKIPVTFSMDEYGVITMTTADGTTYTCDIGALIKLYTFVDGDEIDFVTTTDAGGNKTITASIKDGSIVGSKLQPNFLADCQAAKAQAELAATSASSDASDAELSSEDSEAWAVGERNGVPVPSTDPAYENNAKYWAQHGTGSSFAGLTDTNFTNLQNGQIAKYNSTTQKWENTEDEGGLLPHFKITSEAGSTVTVVCPDTSVIVPTQTSSGIWQCDVPAYGVYTVHAVINGDDAVRTVTVDTVKEYVIHDEHYSYTLNVYAPTGSSILVTDGGSETYTGTGAGSTAVIFALHQASTQYTITVTYDGLTRTDSITSSATSGQSGSKTIEFGTINLTVDEDLIGETIVMAKGTDTVSKVASSTSMVFYPNATGNWRISVDYEGETVYAEPDPIVVSSLSTPVSAEISLVHIPEGATVTPTDDIQTWLACANITNKSYTTLAEVLSDRETFETLIADSNACDYMARSTTWAGVTGGLVPVMTGYTTPSGRVWFDSSYTEWSPSKIWWLFNGTETGGDNSASGLTQTDSWFAYEFPTPTIVNKFYMMNETQTVVYAGNFTIDASNDGNTWTTLGTFTNSGQGQAGSKTYYDINNETPYLHYRYHNLTQGTGAAESHGWSAQEMQFYHEAICQNADAMSLIGKYDYCSNALLSNATWAAAIASSDYWDSVLNIVNPKMTSNTAPSGEVIYSTYYDNNYLPYYAFNENSSNQWCPSASDSDEHCYIGYSFTDKVLINKVSTDLGNATSWKVQGSNTKDANDWHDLATSTDSTTNIKTLIFANSEPYRHYRLLVMSKASAVPYSSIVAKTVKFYGRATEEVLVPLIPTMTSNTTPSGLAFCGPAINESYPIWKAFDGDDSTFAHTVSTTTGDGHYIGYKFDTPVRANKFTYYCVSTGRKPPTAYLQASNDSTNGADGTWTTLYTLTNTGQETASFDNNIAYRWYRILGNGLSLVYSSYGFIVNTLQLYAKTVQTNIIHSAANDTIYMLEDGDPIVLATTNSDGDGILDFSQLPAGPVTLYSSVAKNPEDLTADYSKTITITKTQYGGTTEAYLMPDTVKTLYWWGYMSDDFEETSPSNGWTNVTNYYSPTFNTNNLTMNASANNMAFGVGNKTAITGMSKAYAIGSGSGSNAQFTCQNQKSFMISITNYATFSSLNKYELTNNSDYGYITANAQYRGNSITLYALWYE